MQWVAILFVARLLCTDRRFIVMLTIRQGGRLLRRSWPVGRVAITGFGRSFWSLSSIITQFYASNLNLRLPNLQYQTVRTIESWSINNQIESFSKRSERRKICANSIKLAVVVFALRNQINRIPLNGNVSFSSSTLFISISRRLNNRSLNAQLISTRRWIKKHRNNILEILIQSTLETVQFQTWL